MPGTPATSTRRKLPRIGYSDTPDVVRDMNNLTDTADATLAGCTTGTSFPVAPLDGDFFFKTNDTTMAATGSLYKWDSTNLVWNPCFPPVDGATTRASARTLGTGAQQATAGNDARLSDARNPLAGSVSAGSFTSGLARAMVSRPVYPGVNTLGDLAVSWASGTTINVGNGSSWILNTINGFLGISFVSIGAATSGMVVGTLPVAGNHCLCLVSVNSSQATVDGFFAGTSASLTITKGADVPYASAPAVPALPAGNEPLALLYRTDVNGLTSISGGAGAPAWVPGSAGGVLDLRCLFSMGNGQVGFARINETTAANIASAGTLTVGASGAATSSSAQGAVGVVVNGNVRTAYIKRAGLFRIKGGHKTTATTSPIMTANVVLLPGSPSAPGGATLDSVTHANNPSRGSVEIPYQLTTGDMVATQMFNNSGAAVTCDTANGGCFTTVHEVR